MSSRISRRHVLKAGISALVAAALPQISSSKEIVAQESEEKKQQSAEPLSDHAITHGGIQFVRDTDLGVDVYGQTCIRYLRFGQQVELDHLDLERQVYGRWVPAVPTHPAHLIISVLDRDNFTWKTISEVDFPADPEITGEGLSLKMKMQDIEDHFSKVLKKSGYLVDLKGYQTDHLRVICDREHPVYPNHGECNGGIFNVPYGILNKLGAFGKPVGKSLFEMSYNPILIKRSIHPAAPKGMQVKLLPEMLLFSE